MSVVVFTYIKENLKAPWFKFFNIYAPCDCCNFSPSRINECSEIILTLTSHIKNPFAKNQNYFVKC